MMDLLTNHSSLQLLVFLLSPVLCFPPSCIIATLWYTTTSESFFSSAACSLGSFWILSLKSHFCLLSCNIQCVNTLTFYTLYHSKTHYCFKYFFYLWVKLCEKKVRTLLSKYLEPCLLLCVLIFSLTL